MQYGPHSNSHAEAGNIPLDVLAQQAAALEAELLVGNAPDTYRGLSAYDREFRRFGIDIRAELEGRVVGDIGSGMGGLAKSAYAEGIDTTVWSVNPHLAVDEFKMYEEQVTPRVMREDYPGISEALIEGAQAYHDSHLRADFAHRLSFEDETFDLLTDVVAVNAYAPENEEELYEQTIKEMMRVLKPGGRVLIVDGYRTAIGVRDEGTGEPMFKERVLQKMGVQYAPAYADGDKDRVMGAILYKSGEAE